VIGDIGEEEVGALLIRLCLEQNPKVRSTRIVKNPGRFLNASKFRPGMVGAAWNFFSALRARLLRN